MSKKVICSLLLGASFFIIGCSKKVEVVKTPGGTIQVEKGRNQVTITGKQGTVTFGNKISEEKLGVPIYPGAAEKGGETFSSNTTKTKKSISMVTLTTQDSFDKVVSFYKSKLPAKTKMDTVNTPEMEMAMFDMKPQYGAKGFHVQITSNPKKKETQIYIMTGTK
jgi:high-affinity K+ transport system ATPase subunit B